jgi:hypothetical protein
MRYRSSNNLPATHPFNSTRTQLNNLLQNNTMFRSIIIFLALAVMAIATKDPNFCYEDGCKRTLQNNSPAGFVQCNKDLSCRVTPAAVVVPRDGGVISRGVVTVTVTKSTSLPAAVAAITDCAKGFPPYLAKSCEYQSASYTSACRCIKATGVTATGYTPTITAKVYTIKPESTTTVYV